MVKKTLHEKGIISHEEIEEYENEIRLAHQKQQEEYKKRQEEQERRDYERLKAKFEDTNN